MSRPGSFRALIRNLRKAKEAKGRAERNDPVAELQRLLDEAGVVPRLHGTPVNLVELRDRIRGRIAEALCQECDGGPDPD